MEIAFRNTEHHDAWIEGKYSKIGLNGHLATILQERMQIIHAARSLKTLLSLRFLKIEQNGTPELLMPLIDDFSVELSVILEDEPKIIIEGIRQSRTNETTRL